MKDNQRVNLIDISLTEVKRRRIATGREKPVLIDSNCTHIAKS
jgi:hypothetical protein